MARWIKADGTVQQIQPKNGIEFTLDEMRACVGGHIEAVKLTSQEVMYVNDEGALQQLPINTIATEVFHQHRPERSHEPICGDVLVASLVETGDEDDNTLRIPIEPVTLPCEECAGENYPNYRYSLVGVEGVLCKPCLNKELATMNAVLSSQQEDRGYDEDFLEARKYEESYLSEEAQKDFLEALNPDNWTETIGLHTPTMEATLEDGKLTIDRANNEAIFSEEDTKALTRFLIEHVKLPPVEPIEDLPDDFQAKRVNTEQEEG